VKEARRLTDLVDEVLAFSGMEAAHSTEPADVASVIREAVAECDGIAAERRVAIESVVDDSLPTVECAPAAATRAVHNLIANAIRHGGDGGWVGVRASAQNGDVIITVADRGPGIVAADLPHLFEPFYRGRNSQVRGSGLGLAIVDRVARTHGGSVTAANRVEGGAEFRLRLPVTS
jgi:two-component system OmpR family sensor kinase